MELLHRCFDSVRQGESLQFRTTLFVNTRFFCDKMTAKASGSVPNAPFKNYTIIENGLTAFDVIPYLRFHHAFCNLFALKTEFRCKTMMKLNKNGLMIL